MAEYSIVLMTAPDAESADRIAEELVRRRLAACVNRVDGVTSRYWWEGKVETAQERLLIAKTRSSLVAELIRCVKTQHPYDVPEAISLPISEGYAPYLDWLGANTLFKASPERSKAEPGV